MRLADAPTRTYTNDVTPDAIRAIAVIRQCVEDDHYGLARHFTERMEQRGLFWPDVQSVIEHPDDVRSRGADRYGRAKWIISGDAEIGERIEVVCAIEIDETETEFITLYWED